jgi:hypothetical protein
MAASLPAPRADPQFTVTLCPLASHTGHADHQSSQPHPRRFAIAAITSAALTGLLGCGTTGLGGAAGVVIGPSPCSPSCHAGSVRPSIAIRSPTR